MGETFFGRRRPRTAGSDTPAANFAAAYDWNVVGPDQGRAPSASTLGSQEDPGAFASSFSPSEYSCCADDNAGAEPMEFAPPSPPVAFAGRSATVSWPTDRTQRLQSCLDRGFQRLV